MAMESILLIDQLKLAIEDDFKGNREKLDKVKKKKKELAELNDNLNKTNGELKAENLSLTKALKDLKEKYDHLQKKLNRKQDEVKKKDKWWDRYRYTAETMIKKLRAKGSFSPQMLHEVSRDLVDIMEEASSGSSQEMEITNPYKLTISKESKKKFRYKEVSPENPSTNPSGTSQSKDLNPRIQCQVKSSGESDRYVEKDLPQRNGSPISTASQGKDIVDPACNGFIITGAKIKIEDEGEEKHREHSPKDNHNTKSNKHSSNSKYIEKCADKKSYEADVNYNDHDEIHTDSIGYPSLTSTPMFASSNKKPLLTGTALHDLSIIPKDAKNLIPRKLVCIPGVDSADLDSLSPLTPAVPATFENLLSRSTLLSKKHSQSTAKIKDNEDEKVLHKGSNELPRVKKDRKYPCTKNLQIRIPDIQKLKQAVQTNGTSQSILENIDWVGGVSDGTIDYPVVFEDKPGSPSILATDIQHVQEPGNLVVSNKEDRMTSKNKLSLTGAKRKRNQYEEERQTPPGKKSSKSSSTENLFKIPAEPLPTKPNKCSKEASGSPECSIVLLSDDEEDDQLESSSVDMFPDNGKPLSEDLSHDKDVIDIMDKEQAKVQPDIKATSSTSQSSKDQLYKEAASENKFLDEEFPGFRKPEELNYKNIKVVRKKDERAKLDGFSCRECETYYGEMTESERKKKLKYCSRHRAKYSPPPSTPPGFWNLSFPDTQEYIAGGMMVTGDKVPQQKPRRPRKTRLLKSVNKQA